MWTLILIILIVLIVILNFYKTIKDKKLPAKTVNIIASILIVLTGILAILEHLKSSQIPREVRKVIAEELDKRLEPSGASSYADGIPQSKNINLLSLFTEGLKYKKNFKYDNAIKAFSAALALKDIKDSESCALYIQIGNCYLDQSKLDEALGNYKQAFSFAERVREDEGKAVALGNIGLIYQAKGDLDRALKYHQDALKINT